MMLIDHINECKKSIDKAVKMINDPFFEANSKVVSDCKQEIVLAQVEINRAEFAMRNEYRWHDLRKNPEDLPKYCGAHMVYRPDNEYARYSLCYCGGDGTWYDGYHHDEDRRLGLNDVIAWREIETIESEAE